MFVEFQYLPCVVGCILGRQVGALVDSHNQSCLLEAVLDGEQELAQTCPILVLSVVDHGCCSWWYNSQTMTSI